MFCNNCVNLTLGAHIFRHKVLLCDFVSWFVCFAACSAQIRGLFHSVVQASVHRVSLLKFSVCQSLTNACDLTICVWDLLLACGQRCCSLPSVSQLLVQVDDSVQLAVVDGNQTFETDVWISLRNSHIWSMAQII
jgi:hypothetical protein